MSVTLSSYLQAHAAGSNPITHTRIGDTQRNIYGGSYHVDDEDLGIFFQIYFNRVLGANPFPEYLTERQRDIGPLVIDLDFRLREPRRQHTSAQLECFIFTVFEELIRMHQDISLGEIEVFVMEKPSINEVSSELIKDGVHIFVGLSMDKTIKEMLRNRLLSRMDQLWDDLKPQLTNDWDSVIDGGVMKGSTGWQLYGSRKPGHESYRVVSFYKVNMDDDIPQMAKYPVPVITSSFLPKLSVRFREYPFWKTSNFCTMKSTTRSGQGRRGRGNGLPS